MSRNHHTAGGVVIRRLILTVLLAVPSLAQAGDIKLSDWAFTAPVEIDGTVLRPMAQFAVTPEILAATKPGLEDLRIAARGSDEIAYIVKTGHDSTGKVPLPVKLYNRTYIAGKESSVTIDFGTRMLKNQVQIDMSGTDFRRRVRIEGSDDGDNWQTVRDRAFLFRVQRSDTQAPAYDGSTITFPDNDLRYVRITVSNAEDDRGVLEIRDVKAWRYEQTPAETASVQVRSVKIEQKKRITEIILDLGYPNLALYELKLAFANPDFFRNVSVWGRNQETRVVRRVVEDSPALEKTVEEPWNRIASGVVFRFSGDGATEESPLLKLGGGKYRYLLIRTENRDDPPLNFEGARVTRLVQHVIFATSKVNRYALYTGNARAAAPEYDMSHYSEKLQTRGVSEARVGELAPNPSHKPMVRELPWSERHKELLWLALLAMAAALGGLVYRMAKGAQRTHES
jgi:hypothetical protein